MLPNMSDKHKIPGVNPRIMYDRGRPRIDSDIPPEDLTDISKMDTAEYPAVGADQEKSTTDTPHGVPTVEES